MSRFSGHRSRWSCALIAACIAFTAHAEAGHLALAEVQRLAIEHQPLLESEAAQAAAARQRAVSAGQLPDPQLKVGVANLPIDTADAGRFNRDSMTQSMMGLSQDIPFAGKRQLRSESETLKADASDAQLAATTRAVERDAGLAYLDLLHPHHAATLLQLQIAEAQRALEASEIAYRTGRRGQSDVLAARAAIGQLNDQAAEFEQMTAVARENLKRWIGDVPDFVPSEPDPPQVPPLDALLATLDRHPELIAADRSVDRAAIGKQLAQKARQPDISVELDYGYRSDYSDMVSLQVGIPLPLFTGNRQNREIAAAQSDLDSQQAVREDLRRRLAAEVAADYRQWEALGTRLDRYGADVIPPLTSRVDAALVEYRSGTGSINAVLDARQALVAAQLSLLELRLQRLRTALKLRYFAPDR